MRLLGGGCFDYDDQGIHPLILWESLLILDVVRAKRKMLREHVRGIGIHSQIA